MVPVGGFYTIDAEEAVQLVKKIEPAIVIPMHYQVEKMNPKLVEKLSPVSEFTKKFGIENLAPIPKLVYKKEEIEQAYSELKTLPLSIIHLSKGTSGDVHAIAAKHRTLQGLDLLVVDYLSYLSDYDEESEVLRLGKITKSLKMTANILDCAVLAPHQLSRRIERRSEGKREQPLLSDLRDSGHIEQDSDVVLFLNRDLLGEEGGARTTLRIGKNRTGQVGIIDLKFDKETTMFQEI